MKGITINSGSQMWDTIKDMFHTNKLLDCLMKKNTYLKGKSYYQTHILYNIFKDPYKESKSEVSNSPNIINSREITTDYTNIRPNIILDGFFPLII